MKRRTIAILVVIVAALAAFGTAALLTNIWERKNEAKNAFVRVVEITDETTDPAVWGQNFPQQYEDYKRTVDQVRTRFGGSEALPRTPTHADPRSVVAQSRLEEDPRLKTMWAGYAFSKDFREERGHAYMLTDQIYTERQKVGQPGTCINCHASVYVPFKKAGKGDLVAGFHAMNKMSYAEARPHFDHPVACIDCHAPDTMALRVTRPAFMEGIKQYKASLGIKDFEVNRDATRQEMRSFVCGQCHVEYYFAGPEKTLTFPWSKGLRADQILAYYQENGFKDWVHAETGAPALKAQHPEFEMWSQGTHARAGVACADCHMPYKRVGAQKVSDHHVRSPLLNINRACQTCHKATEAEIAERVNLIQEKTFSLRNTAMDALMQLIADLKEANAKGTDAAKIKAAQDFQRQAQFLIDFIESENSTGFHAPQEASRILGQAIDLVRQGQLALR